MEEHGGNIWRRLQFADVINGNRIRLTSGEGRDGIGGFEGSRYGSGCSPGRLLDFSANINPLGLPQKVKKAIQDNVSYLVHYPDPEASYLRQSIAEYTGLSPEQILPGNGTTQLIYLIYKVFRPRFVFIPVPSFSEYEKAIPPLKEVYCFFHRLRRKYQFRLDIDRFLKDIDQGMSGRQSTLEGTSNSALVMLGNPNNPTGILIPIDQIIRLVKELYKRHIWLVLDEAFIDFVSDSQGKSLVNLVTRYKNLIVLRTFTKFFSLPGIRVGYAAADKRVISRLKNQMEPWSVNHLAQIAAAVVLKDKEYIKRSQEYLSKEKDFLFSRLKEIIFLEPYPSAVNFILCRIRHGDLVKDSSQLTSKLAQKRILVRDCANFRNLGRNHIRVAVRTRAENKQLIQAFRELM